MEKLFRRLQHNNVTMTVNALRRPDILCVTFSKEINGKEYAQDFLMDILTLKC